MRGFLFPMPENLFVCHGRVGRANGRAMKPKAKIPTELTAIALGCCVGGGVLMLSVAMAAVLLPHHPYPDKVAQTLYKDPSVRPLMICEGIGALLIGATALIAGVMVFMRVKAASSAMRAALALAAIGLVADVVVQGWLVVPALRKLAPSLKPPEALMYDPRLRPALPIAVGLAVLAVLFGITRTLRRSHVRAALASDQPAV